MFASLLKYHLLPVMAGAAAKLPVAPDLSEPSPVFIIGCGRSGTTALGRLLMRHDSILYLHEPGYLWVAIDPRTDFSGAYGAAGQCILESVDLTESARQAARRLFGLIGVLARGRIICEKTPINALRIGWLRAIFPQARFLWIVRSADAVIRSIARISKEVRISIPGRKHYHAWWGVEERKWRCLLADAQAVFGPTPFAFSAAECRDDLVRGAVEWCVSSRLCLDWSQRIPPSHYLAVAHADLAADPASTLSRITAWLGLRSTASALARPHGRWFRQTGLGGQIELPRGLAELVDKLDREIDAYFRRQA